VSVEMPQRGADVPALLHRPRQFPRSVSFVVDPSTVLAPVARVGSQAPCAR
jgi:hypothetical protein